MLLKKKKTNTQNYTYISNESENKTVNLIWKVFVYLFLYLSFSIEYINFVPLTQKYEVVIIAIGFICVSFTAFFNSNEKVSKYASYFPLAGVIISIIIFNPKNLYGGLLGTINYEISRWNLEYDDGRALFHSDLITQNAISHFSVLVAFIVAHFVYVLIKNKKGTPIIIMISLYFVPSLIVGKFDAVAFSLAIIGYAASLMDKNRTAELKRRIIWSLTIFSLILVIAVSVGNLQSQYITELREQQKEILSEIRFGKDTLPQGDLSKAGELLSDNEDRLEIKSKYAKDLYFKGFVGAKYRDGKWSPLSNSDYGGANNGMLTWLENNNFSPIFEYSDYINCEKTDIKTNEIAVSNIGAKRNYIYSPYSTNTFTSENIYQNKDNNIKSSALFGSKKYSYSEKSSGKPSEIITLSAWYSNPENSKQKKYIKAEKIYRNFVYQKYLDVDLDIAGTVSDVFWDNAENSDDESILSATQRIRTVLNETAKYTKTPKSVPENTDPIKWFLTQGKEGNSVYFASSAVLAFRQAGFPARYAEGYYCFNTDEKNETTTLTSQNAHAWVEVYMDGVGWLPIDVTPGFYYDTYALIQFVAKPKQIEKTDENKKNAPDRIKLNEEAGNGNNSAKNKSHNIKLTILGILTLLIILSILLIAFSYIFKLKKIIHYNKAIDSPDARLRQKEMYNIILMLLAADKIDFTLGKDAEITAKQICKIHPEFSEDEFLRVNEILEKYIFGEYELAEFEERTLLSFIEKYYKFVKVIPFKNFKKKNK